MPLDYPLFIYILPSPIHVPCFVQNSITLTLPDVAFTNPKYIGTSGCNCHKPEIADWQNSIHARAFESLKAATKEKAKIMAKLDPQKDYTTDEKCISCHVTGYKEEGGFESMRLNPSKAGVGCESCHGPGSEYADLHREFGLEFYKDENIAAGAVYGSTDEKVCKKCHGHKDSPYQPEIDEKYRYDHKKALKRTETFHKYYEQMVEH